MMNTILVQAHRLLAGGPWQQPNQAITTTPRDPDVAPASRKVGRLPVGFAIAVVMAFVVWFVLSRTTLGFELATVGANKAAAQYAGISVPA